MDNDAYIAEHITRQLLSRAERELAEAIAAIADARVALDKGKVRLADTLVRQSMELLAERASKY